MLSTSCGINKAKRKQTIAINNTSDKRADKFRFTCFEQRSLPNSLASKNIIGPFKINAMAKPKIKGISKEKKELKKEANC